MVFVAMVNESLGKGRNIWKAVIRNHKVEIKMVIMM